MKLLLWPVVVALGVGPAQAQETGASREPLRPIEAVEPAPAEATPEAVFLEAWRVVRSAFYDPELHGVDWEGVKDELLPRAREAATPEELSAVINEALSRLHASHTAHYHPGQREYYEILDVFFPDGVPRRPGSRIRPGRVEYTGIGLATQRIDGKVFALDVYSGGPAEEASILAGDEMVGVEDGPWGDIGPFRGREGQEVRVRVRRRAGEEPREVTVVPRRIRPREMFTESIRRSASVIDYHGRKVAYLRVRSYASPVYQDAVREVMETTFALARTETEGLPLIFDIRGGWGGAMPRYLEVFNSTVPRMVMTNRDGERHEQRQAWDPRMNPVVMLIDGGSRSGKEVLAYGFKKAKVGTLVGERTAGAVLGGTVRPLADGSILYVAVADVEIDGERLEGVGVEPDVVVKRELPYAAGKDPQIRAALEYLTRKREGKE